jgi:hypothetical protein
MLLATLRELVEAKVERHAVQPRPDLRLVRTPRRSRAPQAQERLLRDVLGLGGIAEGAAAERDDARQVAPAERAERLHLAAGDGGHELVVADRRVVGEARRHRRADATRRTGRFPCRPVGVAA